MFILLINLHNTWLNILRSDIVESHSVIYLLYLNLNNEQKQKEVVIETKYFHNYCISLNLKKAKLRDSWINNICSYIYYVSSFFVNLIPKECFSKVFKFSVNRSELAYRCDSC